MDRRTSLSRLSISRPSSGSRGLCAHGACHVDPADKGGGNRGYPDDDVGGGRTGRCGDRPGREAEAEAAGDAERLRLCGLVFIAGSLIHFFGILVVRLTITFPTTICKWSVEVKVSFAFSSNKVGSGTNLRVVAGTDRSIV